MRLPVRGGVLVVEADPGIYGLAMRHSLNSPGGELR